jgi:hypothetical protein
LFPVPQGGVKDDNVFLIVHDAFLIWVKIK